MKHDVIVLGAGMVGVSCALHLQRRGLSVALVDRRAPGLETSFGNSGLVQFEATEPYELPRDLGFLISGAMNRRIDVRYHLDAVLQLAGPLFSYFVQSAPKRHAEISREYKTLIARSIETHAELIEQADAEELIAGKGYLTLFRTERELHKFFEKADARAKLGVSHLKLTAADVAKAEPHLKREFAGAIQWTDPLAIKSPGDLVQAYARLFEKEGGQVLLGDAKSLTRLRPDAWRITLNDRSTVEGEKVVIALGPWSTELTSRFGYRPPMFAKRGYHMHYARQDDRPLNNWVIDAEMGYVVCPMKAGLRLTTGAELAHVDATRTPSQLANAEAIARDVFPLGDRLDAEPWMGARPCMPDMKPVFGRIPGQDGMWCAFGHGHQGFTLGPVTGELLAAQMTGANPRIDVAPFSPARFA
ncbi:FAD-binding oxidoreductase [Ferrovibrio terrae]|uniref:FAD-binding oxidoreductase n=2 Tax=Ferrovibrio terrae TaxID=2594003 RepID=A0A516H7D0_9PROT|nr:FAD-binding oxidoreductase [Ferrovibrio terrae]